MRIGSAMVDISPSTAVPLLGYDFRQQYLPAGNDGLLDPLMARVLAMDGEDGCGLALIISLDLCIISVAFARRLRAYIAEATGVSPARILISCSHTHSGPWLDEDALAADISQVLPHVRGDAAAAARRDYTASLAGIVAAAAAKAQGLMFPVTCQVQDMPLGLGYCRRVVDEQGQLRQCWNPEEYPHLRPAGQADPVLSVLTFRQRGGPRCWALWCHGTHPVVLGKTSSLVSADWPGAANAYLAQHDIEGHFLLGACGDVQPWIATTQRPAAVAMVGHCAGTAVHLLSHSGGPVDDQPQLSIRGQSLHLGGRELDIAAWQLGSLCILSSPTELFAGLAWDLRERLRPSLSGPLMVVTNCNGWTGYWPDRTAFASGGYEIAAAQAMGRQAGDSEALLDALAALLAEAPSS